MAAKRKTPAKSSAKKTTAKKAPAKTAAKRKPPTAKKSAAKPAAAQMPVPGEEAPPPAPEGQPPPDTTTTEATTEAAAMDAAATALPKPGAPPPPSPIPKRRNPLVVPFIIVLILLLLALAALGYWIFLRPVDAGSVTKSTTSTEKAADGTSGNASGGSCGDVTHPEDKAGSLDDATRGGGSDDKPDLVTSNPPTSGTHGKGISSNGSNYTNPQPLGYLVNAMDHGSVIIWHRNLSQDELKDLLEVANTNLRRDFAALVMVPYNDMDSKIALTAWGSLMECDGVNADAINDFVNDFMATGPEAAAACLDMPEDHPRCS